VLPATDILLLVAAGLLAGVVGTAGGITSLISYPALLAAGASPLVASFTNIASLVVCLPGAALASRPELCGWWRWLVRWGCVAMLAGGAGAALLLSTPAGVFARVVPYLLVLAAGSLAAQPRLSRWWDGRSRLPAGAAPAQSPCASTAPAQSPRASTAPAPSGPGSPDGPGGSGGATWRPGPESRALLAGVLATSLYNGYFGAGAGVLTLALILFTAEPRLVTANALKNVLVGSSNLVAAVAFAAVGHVDWPAAWPLALGMLAGSTIGPAVARRIPPAALRTLVALTGAGLAAWFWATGG